jgi:hypothetical protein
MLLCDIASLSRLSITYSFLSLASYALTETPNDSYEAAEQGLIIP